ncbi:uncharacterized protein LOC135388931 [Ornithodoros turicata]|uniref:uncharacterized protein LOC135388931 n=1 Tax=Ornithodoros turicata TaxID=34597 RepID=UPI00313905AD
MTKGVISEDELIECTEAEIQEGLSEQGVICAKRIMIRRDGKEMATKHIILSFKLHTIPTNIKAGYLSCNVRPYVPNPRRCFKCQRFGHSSLACRGHLTCPKCAGKDHTGESCSNEYRCANCQGNHPVYSRSCPRWKDEKEVIRIKTEQNISYKAARTQHEFQKKGSFSEVVRRGVAPQRKSVETQTYSQVIEPPPHTPQQEAGDTQVSPAATEVSRPTGRKEAATALSKANGLQSIWDGGVTTPTQKSTQSMEVDDDDRMSQKSSSSLPEMHPREKREKGRGRGVKTGEPQKPPPRRVQPPK